METFNGILFTDLGLIIQNIQGVLDMPKREGETYYDWGNDFEPLVDQDDIYFGDRLIVMEVFYDERIHSDFKHAMQQLRDITSDANLVTEYGTHVVRLQEVRLKNSYKGGKTLQITFNELNPNLGNGLPTVNGNTSVRIDGYDFFAQFGFLVEKVNLFNVERLKAGKQTHYKTNVLSIYRQAQEIEVKINGIYANKTDMSTKISQFNGLLAKAGMRHFVYNGDGFQCYCDEGAKVQIKRSRVLLTLKLRVMAHYNYDEIVQEVINQVNIQANPQSDLAVTDINDPAFIKSKDTFVAADSSKLNGQTAAFYAKEAEIAALRSLDLALALEQGTPNI